MEPKIVNSLFEDISDYKPSLFERSKWWISRKFSDLLYSFRKARERLTHGFPLCEAWDFRSAHADWCVPRLKWLRDNLNGHPHDLTCEEWESTLNKMIWAFEHHDDHIKPIYSDDYDHRYSVTTTENCHISSGRVYTPLNETGTIDWTPVHEHRGKVDEGLSLFAKYYSNLWD